MLLTLFWLSLLACGVVAAAASVLGGVRVVKHGLFGVDDGRAVEMTDKAIGWGMILWPIPVGLLVAAILVGEVRDHVVPPGLPRRRREPDHVRHVGEGARPDHHGRQHVLRDPVPVTGLQTSPR